MRVTKRYKNDYWVHGRCAETMFDSDLRWKKSSAKKKVVDIEFTDPSAQSVMQ